MASVIKRETALKIYDAIAESPTGLDVEQLSDRTNLNRNTCLIYTRFLARQGCISIESEAKIKGWIRNVYLAITPPVLLTDADVVRAIAAILNDNEPRQLQRIRAVMEQRRCSNLNS